MNDNPNLEKRIKRHLWGQKFPLEVLTDSAFLPETLEELKSLGYKNWEEGDWGIRGIGSFHDLYRLNIQLSTPGRIVLEVARFKAGAREQLFRRARALPWELWFGRPEGLIFDIRTHFHGALIHHEGQGKQALDEAIRARLEEFWGSASDSLRVIPGPRTQRIYLDISGSNVLLFLDTSGDHLGKRGYRLAPGPAPLAENRAAAIIRKLARIQPDPQWILDGMTGSGTFAFESSLFFQGLSVGGGRDFAFSQWPSYRESTKNYWSRQRIEPNVRVGQNEKVKVIANDRDDRSLGAAKMNLDQFRSRFCTGGREPRFVKGDFFSLSSKADEFIGPGWVFLNPPYDYRISGSLDQFANKLTRWIETSGLEGTLVLLLPQNRIVEKFSSIPRVFDDLVFNHGGRGVNLLGLSLK